MLSNHAKIVNIPAVRHKIRRMKTKNFSKHTNFAGAIKKQEYIYNMFN